MSDSRSCFNCGKSGHIQRFCPENDAVYDVNGINIFKMRDNNNEKSRSSSRFAFSSQTVNAPAAASSSVSRSSRRTSDSPAPPSKYVETRSVQKWDFPVLPNKDEKNHKDLMLLINHLPAELQAPLIPYLEQNKKELDRDLKEIFLQRGRRVELTFNTPEGDTIRQEFSQDHVNADAIALFDDLFANADESVRRVGVQGTLHRISRIVHVRLGQVIGVTARVGRSVEGVVEAMTQRRLLDSTKSLLIIGPPNVGKTTILREFARLTSRFEADKPARVVVVVDKTNELAGDSLEPHEAIGTSRWIPCARPDQQHAAMIEGVENHAPDVLIVDEISSRRDVDAARTIAQRGVQLIATAHGCALSQLINDRERAELIGGVTSDVLLGDHAANKRLDGKKSVRKRKAEPVFESALVVRGYFDWIFHENIATAVDDYLEHKAVPALHYKKQGNKVICQPVLSIAPNDSPIFEYIDTEFSKSYSIKLSQTKENK